MFKWADILRGDSWVSCLTYLKISAFYLKGKAANPCQRRPLCSIPEFSSSPMIMHVAFQPRHNGIHGQGRFLTLWPTLLLPWHGACQLLTVSKTQDLAWWPGFQLGWGGEGVLSRKGVHVSTERLAALIWQVGGENCLSFCLVPLKVLYVVALKS